MCCCFGDSTSCCSGACGVSCVLRQYASMCVAPRGVWTCTAWPSGMLLQRWPTSSDCQQKAVSSARFVPRHWTVPGTLGQANWTCVMKLITHMHAHMNTHTHTHTTAVVGSRAAEFISAIYYLLLYQRNVIPRRVCDACATLPLWAIIGRWQRWSRGCWWMSVVGRLSLLHLLSGVCETLPTKWPRSTNMAPIARSKWFTSDGRHKMFNTFICRLRVFRIVHTISTNSPTAVPFHCSVSVRMNNIYTNFFYLTVLFLKDKRTIKKYKKYVQEHCKFPHLVWVH